MALTKQEWFEKIQTFIPAWRFSEHGRVTAAMYKGLAAVLAQVDLDADEQFTATFLTKSVAPVLDMLGMERSIPRIPNEPPALYTARMQQITSHTNKPDLLAVIDSLLIVRGAVIREAGSDAPFAGQCYANRDSFILELRQNYFLIILPRQQHAPYSFAGQAYANQYNAGSSDVTSAIYPTIIAAVNALKALDFMYGIVEKTN